jgi:hypothetical protein
MVQSGDFDWDNFDVEVDRQSWVKVDPKVVMAAVVRVTDAGARLTFGVGQKSGQLTINIFYQGKPKTWYPVTIEEAQGYLAEIANYFHKRAL